MMVTSSPRLHQTSGRPPVALCHRPTQPTSRHRQQGASKNNRAVAASPSQTESDGPRREQQLMQSITKVTALSSHTSQANKATQPPGRREVTAARRHPTPRRRRVANGQWHTHPCHDGDQLQTSWVGKETPSAGREQSASSPTEDSERKNDGESLTDSEGQEFIYMYPSRQSDTDSRARAIYLLSTRGHRETR